MVALGAVLFLLQAAAREVGYLLGRRRVRRGGREGESVATIVGGMIGLLAFVLALTLSFANERFQERRNGALAEANAIGTAWLRAHTVAHPRGEEIARLLADYLRLRAEYIRAPADLAAVAPITTRTNALQGEIWGHMVMLAEERRDAMVESLQRSLNEAFDLTTAERFAFDFRLPREFFWLLVAMTVVSMGALGFQLGLRGTPLRVLSLALIAMWTSVVITILDLGAARLGSFQTGTQAHEWTLQGFEGGIPRPPPRPPGG
jgi:hypothetical protein